MSKQKIDSEKFMVDSSLAYWRGRCGNVVDNSLTKDSLDKFAPCRRFADPNADFLTHAAKCVTQCVKGSVETWDKRLAWTKQAMLCMQP